MAIAKAVRESTAQHTAAASAALAHRMDPKPLKRVFGVFLMLVAINMLRKAVGW
jgi:uncharacterized membrane protein YfcA